MLSESAITVGPEPEISAREVAAPFQHARWAKERNEAEIGPIAITALIGARHEGRLIGFGRLWGDGVFRAAIDDPAPTLEPLIVLRLRTGLTHL